MTSLTNNTVPALVGRTVVSVESTYLGDGDSTYHAVVIGENGYENVALGWDDRGVTVNATRAEVYAYIDHKAAQDQAWHAAKKAREAQHRAEADARAVTRGKLVIVTRGRKVPQGTVGVVAWVGESNWGLRVGLILAGVEGLTYTAIENVEVIEGPVPAPTPRKVATTEVKVANVLAGIGGNVPATWAKLRDGSWGVRVTGEVRVGDVVTVTAQSGKVQDKAIREIAFRGQGYTLCYV